MLSSLQAGSLVRLGENFLAVEPPMGREKFLADSAAKIIFPQSALTSFLGFSPTGKYPDTWGQGLRKERFPQRAFIQEKGGPLLVGSEASRLWAKTVFQRTWALIRRNVVCVCISAFSVYREIKRRYTSLYRTPSFNEFSGKLPKRSLYRGIVNN